MWDISTGNVLRLGENKLITHAVYGYDKLTKQQLIAQYGDPPTFKKLKWPSVSMQLEKEADAYWCMTGLIESAKIPVICHII